MTVENFDLTLRALRNRKPFSPFTVVLVNGDRFEVDYPEALSTREGFGMFIAPGKVPVFFDHEGVNQFVGDLMHQESK